MTPEEYYSQVKEFLSLDKERQRYFNATWYIHVPPHVDGDCRDTLAIEKNEAYLGPGEDERLSRILSDTSRDYQKQPEYQHYFDLCMQVMQCICADRVVPFVGPIRCSSCRKRLSPAAGINGSFGRYCQDCGVTTHSRVLQAVTPTIKVMLAEIIEDRQPPFLHLKHDRLLILADALDDFGMEESVCPKCLAFEHHKKKCKHCEGKGLVPSLLLEHLRQDTVHVRGCASLMALTRQPPSLLQTLVDRGGLQ